jgi:imidazolonepropionase
MSGSESAYAPARLIGPFDQLVTMDDLPPRGPLADHEITILPRAGILCTPQGGASRGGWMILEIDDYDSLRRRWPTADLDTVAPGLAAFPGLVDTHTHMLWAGSRSADFAARLSGTSYQEIAAGGGGIMSTVRAVRESPAADLEADLRRRAAIHLRRGVTTCEVKSGYGLDVANELKILEVIAAANAPAGEQEIAPGPAGSIVPELIPTCLAAHKNPPDSGRSNQEYLEMMAAQLLPEVIRRGLARRVDIFVEVGAFSPEEARPYLAEAANLGFLTTVHADQFSPGGAALAAEMGAVSADHLERSDRAAVSALCDSPTAATALPGASIGLGEPFAPARALLDGGASLVIASDWNPGSAPNGNLLLQASILGTYENLSMAELWAAVTCRAAAVLGLVDRGVLAPGRQADIIAFQGDWRDPMWSQGSMLPAAVWRGGIRVV